jgi:hypothetical protein
MTTTEAKKGVFTVSNIDHWITDVSGKIGKQVFISDINFADDHFTCVTLFKDEHNSNMVTEVFRDNYGNCSIEHIKDSTDGILAAIQCRPTNFDITVREIRSETESPVWIRAIDNTKAQIIVLSPWLEDDLFKVNEIIKEKGIKLAENPAMESVNMQIQVLTPEKISEDISEEANSRQDFSRIGHL